MILHFIYSVMKNLKTFESFHKDTLNSLVKAKEEYNIKKNSIIDDYNSVVMDCMNDLTDNHKYDFDDFIGGALERTYTFIFDINDIDKLFDDLTDAYEKLDNVLGKKPSIEIFYIKKESMGRNTQKSMVFNPGTTVLGIDKIIRNFRRDMAYPLIDLNAYDVVNSKIDTTNAHQINFGNIEFVMKLVLR